MAESLIEYYGDNIDRIHDIFGEDIDYFLKETEYMSDFFSKNKFKEAEVNCYEIADYILEQIESSNFD